MSSRYVWGSESDHLLWSSTVADADLRKVGELSASKAWGGGGDVFRWKNHGFLLGFL